MYKYSIQHGLEVKVQNKSLNHLKRALELMQLESTAFEEYIPELESLINELSQEDYKSNSKDWQ